SRPAPERLAGCPVARSGEDPRTTPAAGDEGEALDFLEPSDTPGSLGRLGHYEVQEVVGRGGMGVVLRAFDETLHRVVAVKVMARQLAASATARRRFAREARATAAVAHDHVVTVYAVEDAGPLPYIVMQYVAGCSLQERLDRTGPLPLAEILRIGMQTAAGLAAAHAQGLVHRDVKPANILLENGVERVKLTDFGLARAADDASLTQSGTVAGTPLFMSPEQAEGRPVDQRSDLFSLGSVLYALCTGRPPFRAGTSMGVLKRVCEDNPTPIREVNPEMPDWLAAVVGRLHAKDPADRFQTAAEVADLLGQLLTHVQHPSVAPLPAVGIPAEEPPAPPRPGGRGARWAVAAVLLLAACAGLGTTEATGVTKVRATVTRIFTPGGTLAVETDDPDVKVTVEGDGGLAIEGAGPQEVRLRPGSYRLRAMKDGKPVALDRDLVTITRGAKRIVRVRLEGAATDAAASKAERGAFVVLGGKGVAERRFDTLSEAVLRSTDGDTIEVRGNGPFVTGPIKVGNHALVLRAGAGYRPVVRLSPEGVQTYEPLLQSNGPLTVEGLELHRFGQKPWKEGQPVPCHIYATGPSLFVAHCAFRADSHEPYHDHIRGHTAECRVRNCAFIAPTLGGAVDAEACQTLILDNCLHLGTMAVGIGAWRAGKDDVRLVMNRNTLLTGTFHAIHYAYSPAVQPVKPGEATRQIKAEVAGNLFDGAFVLNAGVGTLKAPDSNQAEALLRRVFTWAGRENLYHFPDRYVYWTDEKGTGPLPVGGPRNLDEWKKLWGSPETGSVVGTVRYQGGDLLARLAADPLRITPEDFRLRPDSAGYRAGKGGKDLGADVDLVGPGAAYERWKRTPDYRQWLEDTGQIRAEVPEAEPKAFVLLGGEGVAERKFDTLAEAILGSADGDTIEVRGNGPFVTDRLEIQHRLTLRAGAGHRPVITDSAGGLDEDVLIVAGKALWLEGLEFRCSRVRTIVYAGNVLAAANCRFLSRAPVSTCILATCAQIQNCEVLCPPGANFGIDCSAGGTVSVDNSVLVGHFNLADHPAQGGAELRITGNTFVSPSNSIWMHLHLRPKPRPQDPPPKRVRVSASRNIFSGAGGAYIFRQEDDLKPHLSVADAEAWMHRRVEWREENNLYDVVPAWMIAIRSEGVGHTTSHTGLAKWNAFWGLKGTGSSEGVLRFQGGDLNARARADAGKLTPEDFRLRPDSPGHRGGKDGKDIGADIDLVGPGAAYERWKQTPHYQQWLKDTAQVK
ncbi:MAG TPA: serine/threonine-protein kinase, partial [Gemmataceae bacterium]|nr:serine/threonine-protein kinase [Gemmataceae bacterium]